MASTTEYLEYVLDLLTGVPEVSSRKMIGEYLLYASVAGGCLLWLGKDRAGLDDTQGTADQSWR